MSISFTKPSKDSDAIAIIKIDKKESKILYISPDKAEAEISQTEDERLSKPLNLKQAKIVSSAVMAGATIKEITNIYNESLKEEKPTLLSKIVLNAGEKIEPIPSTLSERILLSGPSGRGKSTLAAMYAKKYRVLFPDRPIYLFGADSEDPAFNDLEADENFVFNETTPELVESEMDLDSLSESLCIFDDIDNISDKVLYKWLQTLVENTFSRGRKKEIHVMYISHVLLNSHRSKVINNESTKVYIFPCGSGNRQNFNFLKEYCSMDKKPSQALLDIGSRWIMLSRNEPRYVIHEKGIMML